ncbi:MAG: hypothetical protein AAF685_05385 [Cyanobacteria bacterium P01_C01_bin.89]
MNQLQTSDSPSTTTQPNPDSYCFCGLAFNPPYRDFAIAVAKDLAIHHPGVKYLLLTDKGEDFDGIDNVIAIQRKQKSVLFPYHDRRFAIEEALKRFEHTIQIDTDIRIHRPLPLPAELFSSGGIVAFTRPLASHMEKYQSHEIPIYRALSQKFDVNFNDIQHVGEFIFVVSRNQNKHTLFLDTWEKAAQYLELHRLHGPDGPAMGMAALKSGIHVSHSIWPTEMEKNVVEHLKVSSGKKRLKIKKNRLQKLQARFLYHYRLNRLRLKALRQREFFYD